MHRSFAPPDAWSKATITLPAEESHHLRHVLRAQTGDEAIVLDGQGRMATGRVTIASDLGRSKREAVTIIRIEEIRQMPRLAPRLTLIAAVLKGHAFDWVVEKATELGVGWIRPVLSERVVVRFDEAERMERVERWERVAIAAAKQCGTAWLPRIEPIHRFDEMAPSLGLFDLAIMGSLDPSAQPLRQVLSSEFCPETPADVALLIGPEGDWTAEETQTAVANGVRPASFGRLILRAETAAIYGLSVLSFAYRGV
jgi:16S rRNA (uracil1498-N3)-methyltransferase